MENASKALIIAGAILISILLISVAVFIMNSTRGVQEEMASSMDATQKQSFNAQFTVYQGTNKTASDLKALYNTVMTSNASHDDSLKVTLYSESDSTKAMITASTITELSSGSRYTITVNMNDEALVNEITYKKTSKTPGGGDGGDGDEDIH